MKTGPSRKTSTPSARRVSEPIPRVSNSRIARALAFAAPAENDVTDIVPEAQPAHPRPVDSDTQQLVEPRHSRDFRSRRAHHEADLEDRRRAAQEELLEIERRRREGNAKARQEQVERALLCRRHQALAQHESS